jgi:hypothetical protein
MATSDFRFLPESGFGVVVLTNGAGYPPSGISYYALALALGEDPDSLPYIRREHAMDTLEGAYETYNSSMQITVKRTGDYLEAEWGDGSDYLIPEELDGDERRFSTLVSGRKMPWIFSVDGDRITLTHERYQFRRIGKLPG